MRAASEIMEGDEVYLPVPDPDGDEYTMTKRSMWYAVICVRGGFTIMDKGDIERPGIEAKLYAPDNSRTVMLIADHQVRVIRTRESRPGSHMNVRVIKTDGIIENEMIYYRPRGPQE